MKNNLKNFLKAVLILIFVAIIFFYSLKVYTINNDKNSITIYDNDIKNNNIIYIKEDNENYKIEAWYKKSEYNNLDKYFKLKIDEIIHKFKFEIQNKIINKVSNQKYYIYITFDEYEDEQYLNFVINSKSYSGNISIDENIDTINYDKKNNKIIFLEDILDKTINDTLTIISDYVYNEILKKEEVKEFYLDNYSIIQETIKPIKNNFTKFVIVDNNITFFFERGKILPNVFGIQTVTIPEKIIK